MKIIEFDRSGILLQCRRPDPVECYERQSLYEQSEGGPCLHCPVASWIAVMAFSGRWTNPSAVLEELPLAA